MAFSPKILLGPGAARVTSGTRMSTSRAGGIYRHPYKSASDAGVYCARSVLRYHPDQWRCLPSGQRATAAGSLPGPERLASAVLSPEPLQGTFHLPGEADLNNPGPVIYQVGTEGGFLPAVAVHNNTTPLAPVDNTVNPNVPFNLLLAPAERADVVIDFNGVSAGQSFILYNDAPAPFPSGDTLNDYFTGDGDQTMSGGALNTEMGFGPNTRTLMRIVVGIGTGDSTSISMWRGSLNKKLTDNFLTGNQPGLLYNSGHDPSVPGAVPYAGRVDRLLTLNEDFDDVGRLIQRLGTFTHVLSTNNQGFKTWGLPYMAAVTENPREGAVEVWQVFNLTGDVHPIHFHLVNVQIIQRQPFSGMPGVQGTDWQYTGPPIPPDANELMDGNGADEPRRSHDGDNAVQPAELTQPHGRSQEFPGPTVMNTYGTATS